MNDPVKDLEEFGGEGMPMSPLPPSEVRRRGDRMRRRQQALTAAGAALAVAVIAGGGFLLGGGPDRAAGPQPAGGVSGTSSPSARPTIPGDFPLRDGLAGARRADPAALAEQLDFCGRRPLRGAEPADVRSVELSGGEAATSRTLYLFEGESKARAMHEGVVRAARDCADPDPRDGSTVSLWSTDLEPWSGNTVVHEFADGPTTEPSTQMVHVVTKGSAVLVTSSFGAWYDDHAAGVESTRGKVSGVLEAMDELGEVPEGLPVPVSVTDGP